MHAWLVATHANPAMLAGLPPRPPNLPHLHRLLELLQHALVIRPSILGARRSILRLHVQPSGQAAESAALQERGKIGWRHTSQPCSCPPTHRPILQALHPRPLPSSCWPPLAPDRTSICSPRPAGISSRAPIRRNSQRGTSSSCVCLGGGQDGWTGLRSLMAVRMRKLALWGVGRTVLLCSTVHRPGTWVSRGEIQR